MYHGLPSWIASSQWYIHPGKWTAQNPKSIQVDAWKNEIFRNFNGFEIILGSKKLHFFRAGGISGDRSATISTGHPELHMVLTTWQLRLASVGQSSHVFPPGDPINDFCMRKNKVTNLIVAGKTAIWLYQHNISHVHTYMQYVHVNIKVVILLTKKTPAPGTS